MDDLTRDLFIRGMVAAKAKETADAYRYLEWVLRLDPPLETRVETLYWLSKVAETPAEQRRLLEEALAYDPSDMRCRRALAVVKGELDPAEIIDPDRLTPAPPASDAPAPAPPQEGRKSRPRNTGPLAERLSFGTPGPSGQKPAPTGPLAERLSARGTHGASAGTPTGARSATRFICPQCGGRMTYTPDGQSLTCEYCAARRPPAGPGPVLDNPATAENFLIAMATRKGHLHAVTRQTFNCQGCGIPFLLPPQQLSATCPYCGSAYVVRSPQSRELIDPHLILPFTVDQKQADEAIQDWLKEQKLPNAQVERAAAVYLPAWSFEMAGQVPWSCQVEERRDHWVTETGSEIVYHASVLVPATPHLSAECADELRAFDLKQAVAYDERYLADWMAETYQIAVGDASLEARRWTYEFEKQSVRQHMLRRVRDLAFNSLGITIESFQLALLPVWLGHYTLDENRFEVVVNGLNAAVRGQRPQNWLDRLFKR